ncbi:type IV pilus modification protein PilV [Acinetobacter wanghuae]|uniref:Type IV pilus modification protein PilV n=1 Tax=Acinetobacter wanghuae TaxID=2662362 RepID=A0A5Q0P8M6_9GAMM|nr:type IV pilus modification protein PilV [Acinetobacter wanghuae]MQW92874.1 type IV pilus modification protein PilV [Acinetobacter wanghuae]QGA11988.1 type IV pilus modification protein PilV [Acinetobacter wanghuae]
MKSKSQIGVGLVEVLVALLLLSIAVLGFVALQVRAIMASEEAAHNIQAMNLARDLSERMRMNRDGLAFYKLATSGTPEECDKKYCSPADLAVYDYAQVSKRADHEGMRLAILDCQGTDKDFKRKCVYVAWGDTIPADKTTQTAASEIAAGATPCTDSTSYSPGAQCVIVEVYNYD